MIYGYFFSPVQISMKSPFALPRQCCHFSYLRFLRHCIFDLRCLETGIFLRFVIKLVLSFHGYAAFLLEKTGLMKLYSFFRFYHYLFWRGCSTFGNTTQCQTGSFVCLSYVAMPPTNSKCLIYNHFSHSNLVAFPRSSCACS